MYRKILAALDATDADKRLLPQLRDLASLMDSDVLLVHVADGWVAQWQDRLNLADSEEMRQDMRYLQETLAGLEGEGLRVRAVLAQGDPGAEILKLARSEQCDLIVMTTHGHRFLADFLLGSTINKVRHGAEIPVLVIPAARNP